MLLGYARISTAEQNLDGQIVALTAAGVDASRIYSDTASGATTSRPGLDELLRSVREGDVIVIPRLDRLGRSLPELITLVSRIERTGAGLRSLSETIDTTTPTGRLLFHLFGSIAEFERGLIRERTMAGLAAARKRGVRGGRPHSLDGARKAAAARLWASPEIPIEEIAAQLGVSRRTLYRAFGRRYADGSDK